MDDTPPTKEELGKLFEAALAFKQQAPWQWMWDAQIWGIRNPETGQIGYSLGLKFRGRQEWPRFRSYVPGYVDWYVSGEEARFLTLALGQTVEMALRLKADPMLLEPTEDGRFLVRTRTDQGWVEEWLAPEPIPIPGFMALDEADADSLKQHLTTRIKKIEVDAYGLTTIRNEQGGRPYIGYHFMVVESEQGLILGTE